MHETYGASWNEADQYNDYRDTDELEQEQPNNEYTIRDMERELGKLKKLRDKLKRAIQEKEKESFKAFRIATEERPWTLYLLGLCFIFGCIYIFIIESYSTFWGLEIGLSVAVLVLVVMDGAKILLKFTKAYKGELREKMSSIKELREQLNEVEENIQFKEDMVNTAKATAIRPKNIVNSAKMPTVVQMEKSITVARERINSWSSGLGKYKKALNNVLDKCSKLVALCKDDSSAINEISNIYNVLISETLSVIERYSDDNSAETKHELEKLISSFDGYVDRKLSKYQGMRDMAMNCDISTLCKIFEAE